ncbi:MAG: PilN domain-containing protein [Proteobacteria bacterium]|nr:PilN domain-containing protein [Pseudomonadota bacterium]
MKEATGFKTLRIYAVSSRLSLTKTIRRLWKVLTFSLVEGIIFPAQNLCVSIGMTGLSIAYGSMFLSRVQMKGFREFPFEDDRRPDPEHIAELVSTTINDLKANKTEITLSIPKLWAIVQSVEFPLAVKENLPNVISYELDRLTSLSPENALYDFRILREEADRIHILLVAARADVVNPYIEALRKKGIPVKRLTVNISGISALLAYLEQGTDALFFEINRRGYEGGRIQEGLIMSAFNGSFSADDGETWADAIMTAINYPAASRGAINPLIAAHSEQGKPLQLIADFRDGLEVMPERKLALPVKNLQDLNMAPLFAKNLQTVRELPFTALGGVLESLWPKAWKLDLLGKGTQKRSKAPMGVSAFLLFVMIATGIFYLVAPLQIEKTRGHEIDRRTALIKGDVRKVEAIKKEGDLLAGEIATINSFKQNSPMTLAILKELTAVLPKTSWLTRVRITETTVDIEGYASAAAELLSKLEGSSNFKKVEFASTTTRDQKMNTDRFAIKMEIKGLKKEKAENIKP